MWSSYRWGGGARTRRRSSSSRGGVFQRSCLRPAHLLRCTPRLPVPCPPTTGSPPRCPSPSSQPWRPLLYGPSLLPHCPPQRPPLPWTCLSSQDISRPLPLPAMMPPAVAPTPAPPLPHPSLSLLLNLSSLPASPSLPRLPPSPQQVDSLPLLKTTTISIRGVASGSLKNVGQRKLVNSTRKQATAISTRIGQATAKY